MKTEYHLPLLQGRVYHIYNKAVSGRKLFIQTKDYHRFLRKYAEYFTDYLNTIAYCLIPNHFHLMAKVKMIDDYITESIKKEGTAASRAFQGDDASFHNFLTDQFRRLFSGHSLYINQKYKLEGPLFLNKFKKTGVYSEQKYFDLLCYIHHNPIHHGLTKNYTEWQFSSYSEYINEPYLIDTEALFHLIGTGDLISDKKEFIIMHEKFRKNFSERE